MGLLLSSWLMRLRDEVAGFGVWLEAFVKALSIIPWLTPESFGCDRLTRSQSHFLASRSESNGRCSVRRAAKMLSRTATVPPSAHGRWVMGKGRELAVRGPWWLASLALSTVLSAARVGEAHRSPVSHSSASYVINPSAWRWLDRTCRRTSRFASGRPIDRAWP